MAVFHVQYSMRLALLLLLPFLFSPPQSVTAEIREFQIERSNDNLTFLGSFSFTSDGHVELSVSHLVVYSPEKVSAPDTFSMGFLLIHKSNASATLLSQSSTGKCILTAPNVTKLFSVLDMHSAQNGGEYPVFNFHSNAPSEGGYSLFFANCEPSRLVSASVKTEFYNQRKSRARYYLPAGTEAVPFIHFAMALAYLAMTVLWLWHARNLVALRTFHVCLTFLLIANILLSLALGIQYARIQTVGTAGHWSSIVTVLLVCYGTLLLATFFTGLLNMEPYASEFERGLLLLAVPSLIVTNVALSLLPDTSSTTIWRPCFAYFSSILNTVVAISWGTLSLLLVLSLLSWLCSLSWTLKQTGQSTYQDDRDIDNPFSRFYVLASVYFMSVTFLTYFLEQKLSFNFEWAVFLLQKLAIVFFYAYVLHKFRPRTEKSVYQLFDETDSVDEELDNL